MKGKNRKLDKTKNRFLGDFFCAIQKNVVTLQSQTKNLQTYYKKRLLALALAKALPKPRDREQAKIRFHAFSIFIPTGCLEPTSHRFYNKYEEKITSYVCRSVFYSDDVH